MMQKYSLQGVYCTECGVFIGYRFQNPDIETPDIFCHECARMYVIVGQWIAPNTMPTESEYKMFWTVEKDNATVQKNFRTIYGLQDLQQRLSIPKLANKTLDTDE